MPTAGGDQTSKPKSYSEKIASALETPPQAFGFSYRVLDTGIDEGFFDELGDLLDSDIHELIFAVVSSVKGIQFVSQFDPHQNLDNHFFATQRMKDRADHLVFTAYRQNRDEDDNLVYVTTVYLRCFDNINPGSKHFGEVLIFSRHGKDKKPLFPSGGPTRSAP